MTRRALITASSLWLLGPLSARIAWAQSVTNVIYHPSGLINIAFSGTNELNTYPDGSVTTLKSVDLKGMTNVPITALSKNFATKGLPGPFTIPANSTVTFSLWMDQTASVGTIYPGATLSYIDGSGFGHSICGATGPAPLTTTATKFTFSCTVPSALQLIQPDSFYVNAYATLTTSPGKKTDLYVDFYIGGTLNGTDDSQVVVPELNPTINSLSPTSGGAGTTVTMTGTGFGVPTSPGHGQAAFVTFFNGFTATPSSLSDTQIVVDVPPGATTGSVTVTTVVNTSNGVNFTVLPPAINGLSPTSGGVGTPVGISGAGFGDVQSSSTVTFNGVVARTGSWSGTKISAEVPNGATTGPVVVTVASPSNGVNFAIATTGTISGTVSNVAGSAIAGASVSALQSGVTQASTTTAANGSYTIAGLTTGSYDIQASASGYGTVLNPQVQVPPAGTTTLNVTLSSPTINSVSPTFGAPGTAVTIQGSYFGATQGSSAVSFNGVTAAPTRWSNTTIAAQVPAGASTGPVVVTVGGAPSNGVTFTIETGSLAVTVTRASDGTAVSGAVLKVLQANAVVTSAATGTNGTFTFTGLVSGSYDLLISAPAYGTTLRTGNSVPISGTTNVSVALPSPGTISGMVTKSDGVTVIAGAAVVVSGSSDTFGTATTDSNGHYSVPNLAGGTYAVQASAMGYASQTQNGVTLTTGGTAGANFSLSAAPTVSYVYDELGRLVGVVDPTSADAVYNYDSVGNLLSISRAASGSTSVITFTPKSGPVGTTVTITGTGFSATPSQDTVTFNGTSAAVASASNTQIVTTAPSSGAITVSSPSGSATSASSFTIVASGVPTVSGFTPTVAAIGTSVTISGANFSTTAANDKVRFNMGSTAPSSPPTANSISASVPSGATSGRISVLTPAGTGVSLSDFFVAPPPYPATAVVLNSRMAIGQTITYSMNLTGAGQVGLVLFDGTASQRVSVNLTNVNFPPGCSSGGINVSLLGPNASTLASSGCASSGGFIDTITLPTAGTYTLLLTPSGGTSGSLTITLSNVVDLTGSIIPGSSVTLNPSVPGQNAYLTFSGMPGQLVTVQITANTTCSTVSLLKPDTTTLTSTHSCSSAFSLTQQTLPISGTYSIFVNPDGASTGSITVTLTSP